MRHVYFDESGVGSLKEDTHSTVAGLIVDCDRQLRQVEGFLKHLRKRYIPESHRKGFVFHASDLFRRSGPVFDRGNPLVLDNEVEDIIDSLASIPEKFSLPIFLCQTDKELMAGRNGLGTASAADKTLNAHGSAFFFCVVTAERWMRENTSGEYCQLVVEDNDHAKKIFSETNKLLCNENVESMLDMENLAATGKYFPLTHIRNTPLFETKSEDSVLIVADFCSHVFAKARKTVDHPIFEPIAVRLAKSWYWPWKPTKTSSF